MQVLHPKESVAEQGVDLLEGNVVGQESVGSNGKGSGTGQMVEVSKAW